MTTEIKTLFEEFDFTLNILSEDFDISEGGKRYPWELGAVAVKREAEARHGSRACKVIVGNRPRDDKKKEIRRQVLELCRQQGVDVDKLEREEAAERKKSKRKRSGSTESSSTRSKNTRDDEERKNEWKEFATKHPTLSKVIGGAAKVGLVMAMMHSVASGERVSLDIFNPNLEDKPQLRRTLKKK